MILFNFVPIKAGGGQQNALSFLKNIYNKDLSFDYIVACTENTHVHFFCRDHNIKHIVYSDSLAGRLLFETLGFYDIKKKYPIKTIFTIFGSAPIFSTDVYKISGCAYSNIFQPEVNIWGYLKPHKKFTKKLIDFIRASSLLLSDEIILETEYLKKRASKGLLKNKNISVIEMSPSKLVTDELRSMKTISLDSKESYNFLYLSGPQPNKRIEKFLDIIYFLNKNYDRNFILHTTLPENSHYYQKIVKPKVEKLNIKDFFKNLGQIPPDNVGKVITEADAIVNVALLESFSNNWVEAWASKRLLIVTDAEWSRASCKEGALYIDPLKPEDAASRIYRVFTKQQSYNRFIENGLSILKELPTTQERTKDYLDILTKSLRH